MWDWIVLRKVIASLVLPPAGPLLCAVLGLLLAYQHQRLGRRLAWLGVLSLLLLSLPVVSGWLVSRAGDDRPLDLARASDAQAIVILGGGTRRMAPEYGRDTLGPLTLERVRYGAFLARKTGLPILVSGGTVREGEAEAVLMKDALEDEFHLPVRWLENKSRDTHQNARYSAPLLAAAGVTRILLVTHPFDTVRARAEFEVTGLEVTVAPTGAGLASDGPLVASDFIPSARALLGSYYACYEMLAIAVMHAKAAFTSARYSRARPAVSRISLRAERG